MRLNNVFMCKSGVIGMQFNYGKQAILSVYHDGKALQVSEDHPEVFQTQAIKMYSFLHNRYKRR